MYKYCQYVNLQMHCLISNIIRLAFQREHPKSPKTAEFARVRRNVESVPCVHNRMKLHALYYHVNGKTSSRAGLR